MTDEHPGETPEERDTRITAAGPECLADRLRAIAGLPHLSAEDSETVADAAGEVERLRARVAKLEERLEIDYESVTPRLKPGACRSPNY